MTGGVAEELGACAALSASCRSSLARSLCASSRDGHREHAALELEYGVLIEEVGGSWGLSVVELQGTYNENAGCPQAWQ